MGFIGDILIGLLFHRTNRPSAARRYSLHRERRHSLHLPFWSQKADSAGSCLIRALPKLNASHKMCILPCHSAQIPIASQNRFAWARIPYRTFKQRAISSIGRKAFNPTTLFLAVRFCLADSWAKDGRKGVLRCTCKKEEGATVLKGGPNLFLHLPTASPHISNFWPTSCPKGDFSPFTPSRVIICLSLTPQHSKRSDRALSDSEPCFFFFRRLAYRFAPETPLRLAYRISPSREQLANSLAKPPSAMSGTCCEPPR